MSIAWLPPGLRCGSAFSVRRFSRPLAGLWLAIGLGTLAPVMQAMETPEPMEHRPAERLMHARTPEGADWIWRVSVEAYRYGEPRFALSHYRISPAGRTERPRSFTILGDDIPKVLTALRKFADWESQTETASPPAFTKDFFESASQRWVFSWDGQAGSLMIMTNGGGISDVLNLTDASTFADLLVDREQLVSEYSHEREKAQAFSDSLK